MYLDHGEDTLVRLRICGDYKVVVFVPFDEVVPGPPGFGIRGVLIFHSHTHKLLVGRHLHNIPFVLDVQVEHVTGRGTLENEFRPSIGLKMKLSTIFTSLFLNLGR